MQAEVEVDSIAAAVGEEEYHRDRVVKDIVAAGTVGVH